MKKWLKDFKFFYRVRKKLMIADQIIQKRTNSQIHGRSGVSHIPGTRHLPVLKLQLFAKDKLGVEGLTAPFHVTKFKSHFGQKRVEKINKACVVMG